MKRPWEGQRLAIDATAHNSNKNSTFLLLIVRLSQALLARGSARLARTPITTSCLFQWQTKKDGIFTVLFSLEYKGRN